MATEQSTTDIPAKKPREKSRWWRALLIGGGGLLGIGLIGAGLAYWMYADKMQSIITDAANDYIKRMVQRDAQVKGGAPIDVKIGVVDYQFFARTLDVKDIRIRTGDTKNLTEVYMDLNVPLVKVSGVNPWDILFGSGLSLGDITIDEPSLYRRPAKVSFSDSSIAARTRISADSAAADTALVKLPVLPNVDSLVASLLGAILPDNVKPLWINSLSVNEGTYVLADANHQRSIGGSMVGLNIRFNSLSIKETTSDYKAVGKTYVSVRRWTRPFDDGDTVELYGGRIVVDEQDSSMYIDSVDYIVPKSSRTFASGVHISFRQRSVAIDTFGARPTISDAAIFAKTPFRTDRMRVSARNVILKEVDTKGLVNGTALRAHTLDFSKFYIDVLSNSRGKKNKGKRPVMPYELIASIPFRLGIDSVRFGDCAITYGELHPNSNTPAILQFSKIGFLVTGLSNDPEVQKKQPVKIFAKGAFQKNGVMQLEITLPLNVQQNTFDAEASLAEMELATFNTFLPIAENIKVKSGWVKKASFKLKVRGRQATGVVTPQYIDFELEVLNKSSKKAGFWEGIASFLANWLKIKNENVPGKDMKVGTIAYTIPADASVFQALWFPVRDGLGKVIGF